MKKLLVILFNMLFISSAYSLDFDSNTDQCLRDILDKSVGEIIEADLQRIDEFYCYSDISMESFNLVVNNLSDNVKVSVGQEDKEGYIEGVVYNGVFIPAALIDNKMIPGIWKEDVFIPGLYDLKNNVFLPGIVYEKDFIPGAIKNGEFFAGRLNKELIIFEEEFKQINLDGIFDASPRNFDDVTNLFDKSTPTGISRDNIFKINMEDPTLYKGRLFLNSDDYDRASDDGQEIGKKASFITAGPAFIAALIIGGKSMTLGTAIATATVASGGAFIAVSLGVTIIYGGYYIYDKITGCEHKYKNGKYVKIENKKTNKTEDTTKTENKKEEKKEEKKEIKKEEKKKNDEEEKKKKKDTGCQSPHSEYNSHSEPIVGQPDKGDIDHPENKNQTTSNNSGNMNTNKGDICWGENGDPNDSITSKKPKVKVKLKKGDIDWGDHKIKPIPMLKINK